MRSSRTGARGMWLRAKAHDDRYLLRRRFGRIDAELYRAAHWLVDNGYAHWIRFPSSLGPGITLTNRPWQM